MNILDLPEEIQIHIFAHLKPRCLLKVAKICDLWSILALDPSLWRCMNHEMLEVVPSIHSLCVQHSKSVRVVQFDYRSPRVLDSNSFTHIGLLCKNLVELDLGTGCFQSSNIYFRAIAPLRLVKLRLAGLGALVNDENFGAVMHSLSCRKTLRYLDLTSTRITEYSVAKILLYCTLLETLMIGNTRVMHIPRVKTNLTKLFMHSLPIMFLDGIQYMTTLEVLDLEKCNISVGSELDNIPVENLKFLSLAAVRFNAFLLRNILKRAKYLEFLDLTDCEHVTDDLIHNISHLKLKTLRIGNCSQLTDTSLHYLMNGECKSAIKVLELNRLPNLTVEPILSAMNEMPGLKVVQLFDTCDNIPLHRIRSSVQVRKFTVPNQEPFVKMSVTKREHSCILI